MRTSGWKVGDYLVIDDGTGEKIYASQARKLWDGTIQRIDHYETRHPQEFLRVRPEAPPPKDIRPEVLASAHDPALLIFVGNTNITAPTGPASHLFDVGIGEMSVGPNGSWIVR